MLFNDYQLLTKEIIHSEFCTEKNKTTSAIDFNTWNINDPNFTLFQLKFQNKALKVAEKRLNLHHDLAYPYMSS